MLRKLKILLFAILFPSFVWAAEPSVSSYTGTLADGNTIDVSGANFGAGPQSLSADYWEVFDDHTSDWSCNAASGCDAFPAPGSKWSTDDQFTRLVWSGDEACQTYVGEPLLRLDGDNTNYSTGRGYTRSVEHYDDETYPPGCINGAFPNAGIAWYPDTSTELYLVFYYKHDSIWQNPYTGNDTEKFLEFFGSNSDKIQWQWDTAEHQSGDPFSPADSRSFPLFAGFGGTTTTCDPPDIDGAFPTPGKWHELKIHIKMDTDGTDGVIEAWQDGAKSIDDSTVDIRGGSSITFGASGNTERYPHFFGNLQSAQHQFTLPGEGNEWEQSADDIFLWLSDQSSLDSRFPLIACVYVSDQSTWGSGPSDMVNGDSNFVRQSIGGTTAGSDLGFMSWSDSGFKFEFQKGPLSGPPYYLYVYSWSGEHNSAGYLLSGSSGSTTNQAGPGTTNSAGPGTVNQVSAE